MVRDHPALSGHEHHDRQHSEHAPYDLTQNRFVDSVGEPCSETPSDHCAHRAVYRGLERKTGRNGMAYRPRCRGERHYERRSPYAFMHLVLHDENQDEQYHDTAACPKQAGHYTYQDPEQQTGRYDIGP